MQEHLSSQWRLAWPSAAEADADAPATLKAIKGTVKRVALLAMQSAPAPLADAEPAGGTSVYVASVASALARIGVACDVYTRATSPHQPLLREIEPGVQLLHVPAGPRMPVSRRRLVPLLEAFTGGVAELGDELGPYQILSAHWWISGLAGLRLRDRWRVPLEFRSHSLALERNRALPASDMIRSPERAHAEARVIAEADLLIAGSSSEHADLTGRYGASTDKIRLVPCGVDADLFCPGDRQRARDRLGLSLEGRHLLVYVGRLDPIKGIDLAVSTLSALSEGWPDLDVELLVVGGSWQPTRYRQQLATLRNEVNWQAAAGRVHFIPARPHRALSHVYQAADLLLMPSRTETFGLVALEAQACGLPVVASRAGSLPEVISHGISGALIPERDAYVWARAIAALLEDPARLQAMRAAAMAQASRFSWHATATGVLAAYYETVAGFLRPRAHVSRLS